MERNKSSFTATLMNIFHKKLKHLQFILRKRKINYFEPIYYFIELI